MRAKFCIDLARFFTDFAWEIKNNLKIFCCDFGRFIDDFVAILASCMPLL